MSTVISRWHFLHQIGRPRASVFGETRRSFRFPQYGHCRNPSFPTDSLPEIGTEVNEITHISQK